MNLVAQIESDLQTQLEIFKEILLMTAHDADALRRSASEELEENTTKKEELLNKLNGAIATLKRNSDLWQTLPPTERERHPRIKTLLQQGHDAIMKVLMLDRQNEQALLKQGLVPASMLPSANKQRPGYVASLYSRNQ